MNEDYETDTELAADTSEDTPAPEENTASEPAEAELSPDPVPAPEPEELSASMEVVTVEDLLGRLTEAQEGEETEEAAPEEEASTDLPSGTDLPAAEIDGGPLEVVGMNILLKHLETIQGTAEHPVMETPFEDYTVTEGLLLLIFVILVLDFFLNLLRRWF